jgi:hypothetical protein
VDRNCCKRNRRPAEASVIADHSGRWKVFSGPLGPLEGFSGPLGPLEGFSGPLRPLEGFSGPLRPLEGLPPELLKGRAAGRGAGALEGWLNEFLLRECYSPLLPTPANIIRPPRAKNHVYFCIRSIVKSI